VVRRRGLAALALMALCLAPLRARAQQRDPREVDAKRACLGGRPDRGIELLAELYAETNDATYIYNQARCYQQNGRAQDAITRFRESLRKSPTVYAGERAQVQGFISELEAQVRVAPAPPPAPVPAAAAPAVATPVGSPAPDARDAGGHRLRGAGIASGVVGVALLAGGLYMGLRARSLSDEVSRDGQKTQDGMPGTFSQSKYDEGRRDVTLQWVGIGVGAAALAAGGVLYMLGGHGGAQESASVVATPAVGPGLAGGAVRVVF